MGDYEVIYLIIFKVLLISLLLLYFNVFDRQSLVIYLSSIFGIFFFYGIGNIAEMILFFTALSFIIYCLSISLLKNKFSFFENNYMLKFTVIHIFSAGFVWSYVFSPLMFFFNTRVFHFLFIILFYFIWSKLIKISLFDKKPFVFFNYSIYAFIIFVVLIILGNIGAIFRSAYFGFIYVLFYLSFYSIYLAFTEDISIANLKPGMFIAEKIIKTERKYTRFMPFYFGTAHYLRSKIMNKMNHDVEVLKPLKSLSKDEILMLKHIAKAYGFETYKIQKKIDMRYFVLMGIGLSWIFYLVN